MNSRAVGLASVLGLCGVGLVVAVRARSAGTVRARPAGTEEDHVDGRDRFDNAVGRDRFDNADVDRDRFEDHVDGRDRFDDAEADGASGELRTERAYRRIVIHHSGAPSSRWSWADIVADHRAKWSDVGYHFGIGEDGTLHTGRPLDRVGAHAKGANTGSVGLCLLGRFTLWSQVPASQRAQLAELVDALCTYRGLTVAAVVGHREVGTTDTACPGFDPAELRRWLAAQLPHLASAAAV